MYIRKFLWHFIYGQVNTWSQAKAHQLGKKKKKKFDPYLTPHTKENSIQTKGAKYEKNSNKIHESLKKKNLGMLEILLTKIKGKKKKKATKKSKMGPHKKV